MNEPNPMELIWTVEIRRRMPVGHFLAGEDSIRGSGPTPADAIAEAHGRLGFASIELSHVRSLLNEAEATT